MKKKMYLAAAGLIFGGCLLGIGLEATVRAAGGGAGNRPALSAEETACESSGALSEKELKQREEERRRETEESFRIYEEFGLTYDKEQNRFFYEGKQVRHFNDQIGESSNAFHHDEGVIDVIPIRNGRGELTGLRQASEEEFAERTKQQEATHAWFPAELAEDACMEVGEMDFAGYEIYEPFGLTYTKDGLMFEGEPVRYFLDGVEIEEGCMTARHQYFNEKGTVDVHTVRAVIDNGDGSYDPFGDLIRLERYSEEEFLERDLKIFSFHSGGGKLSGVEKVE